VKFSSLLIATLLFTLSVSANTVMRCESDGARRECRFNGPADIAISRQLSRASCVEGRSWGVDGNRIWVDRGCRADFVVAERSYRRGGNTLVCESNGHREFCRADTTNGVRMTNQLSRANCVEGRSWGFNNNGIWVDDGCRAEFTLGGRGGYGHHREAERIICESDNDRTHRCAADTSYGVRISRQLSRADCIYGRTWGYNSSGIWVRDGCRAEFVLGR